MSGSTTLSALGLTPGVAGRGLALLIGLGLIVWDLSGADLRRLVGAVLMGVGVACAMGCTLGQGMFALSTASAVDLRQRVAASQQRAADDLRETNEDDAQLRRSMVDLSSQIEALRSDVATLRGQAETLAHDVAVMQRGQKDMTQGVDERLRNSESAIVTVDGRAFVAGAAEIKEFEAALATLRKGDFADAQAGFGSFMKRYPHSGYKPSALFWLGNAHYASHNYREAEANFRALVTAEPDHLRAPEALLSMANCQVELMDVKAARKTLEALAKGYPRSEAASVAKERLTTLR